jgi:SAM-dependent methyltransferase
VSAPPLLPAQAPYADEAFAALSEAEERHPWFRSRTELVTWAIRRYFSHARRLLDVGCGTGLVLAGIGEALPHLELTGLDRSRRALELTRARVPTATIVRGDASSLPERTTFDVACALDVLEHLDDDDGALAELRRVVVPGGGIVLTAPQHPRLWSALDEYACHRRRYRRHELADKVRRSGFEVLRETSFVSLLLPALATSRLRSRRRADYDFAAELTLPRGAERALAAALALERVMIARGVSWPLGGSVLVIARRPR